MPISPMDRKTNSARERQAARYKPTTHSKNSSKTQSKTWEQDAVKSNDSRNILRKRSGAPN